MPSTINADNGVVSGSSGVKTTADTSGVLALQSNGSTGLTLDTSLNVGIGTSSPTTKLTIGTGTYSTAASGTTGMYTTATGLEMLSDSYFFGDRTGSTLMHLISTGNLGIGTSSPATKLAVAGGISGTAGANISGAGWGVLPYVANSLVLDNNGGESRFFATGANATTDGSFLFYTGQTDGGANERLRIGTAGQLGIGGANYGSSGQVLTSGGSGAAPTWATPSAGAMVLISTTTASSSSAVTFSSLSGYNNYRILISGLTFSGSTTLELQFGQPSIVTSGYVYSQIYLDSIAIQKSFNQSDSRIYLISSTISTNASRGVGGSVDVFDMTSGKYPRINSNVGYYNDSPTSWTFMQSWGVFDNNGTGTTVIKIYPGGGTFSGKISIYGITA